jgi:hypothetical protein
VALLLEQQSGDGAVHPAGQGNEDSFAGGHVPYDAGRREFVKLTVMRPAWNLHRNVTCCALARKPAAALLWT